MFLAAFRSRSWVMPHSVQVQDLTSRGFFPELNPHPGHSRLEGNQRLTPATLRWQRNAFSSNNRTSVDQLASTTDFASRVRARPDPPQVLRMDRLVIAGDAVGQLSMCVQAGIADLTMLDGNPEHRLGGPVRPPRLPCQ